MANSAQSKTNAAPVDTIDSLESSEWPSLSDVCVNVKNGTSSKDGKRNKSPPQKIEGYDSSKENEESQPASSRRGGRKRDRKLKWNVLDNPGFCSVQPYRKRFENRNGRSNNDSVQDKNESQVNGLDSNKGAPRGGSRVRGRRGRSIPVNFRGNGRETSITREDETTVASVHYVPYHQQTAAAVCSPDEDELSAAIRKQVEYYFSEENLVKDMYMRHNMDEMGYVDIEMIAGFPKISKMKVSLDKVIESVERSDKLEVFDRSMVRPVINPLKWPLPNYEVAAVTAEVVQTPLRPDVPDFVPGQPYVLASLVEDMTNLHFYSAYDSTNSGFFFSNTFMEPLPAGMAT